MSIKQLPLLLFLMIFANVVSALITRSIIVGIESKPSPSFREDG